MHHVHMRRELQKIIPFNYSLWKEILKDGFLLIQMLRSSMDEGSSTFYGIFQTLKPNG